MFAAVPDIVTVRARADSHATDAAAGRLARGRAGGHPPGRCTAQLTGEMVFIASVSDGLHRHRPLLHEPVETAPRHRHGIRGDGRPRARGGGDSMITVVGGTGRLGTALRSRSSVGRRTVRVVAQCVAPPTPVPGRRVVAADVREPATLPVAVDGSTVVVSAVHGLGPRARRSPAEVDRDGNRALIAAAARRPAPPSCSCRSSESALTTRRVVPHEGRRRSRAPRSASRRGRRTGPSCGPPRSRSCGSTSSGHERSRSGVPTVMGPGRQPSQLRVGRGRRGGRRPRAAVDRVTAGPHHRGRGRRTVQPDRACGRCAHGPGRGAYRAHPHRHRLGQSRTLLRPVRPPWPGSPRLWSWNASPSPTTRAGPRPVSWLPGSARRARLVARGDLP